ncbi:hypothetical protein LCGC14_1743660, partial [marine sediment metagenome]
SKSDYRFKWIKIEVNQMAFRGRSDKP